MAKLNANINRATYSIKKFLGLNQSDSGETHLKAGEASKLVNFRVTDAGELTPRPVLSKKIVSETSASVDFVVSESAPLTLYGDIEETGGSFSVVGEPICTVTDLLATPLTPYLGKSFFVKSEKVYALTGYRPMYNRVYGDEMQPAGKVLTLWSGHFNGYVILLAVTGSGLFRVSESDKYFSLYKLAAFTDFASADHVEVFGFDDKVYMLGGGHYLVYDGATATEVQGYTPCVLTACEPNGSGTTLERVNNLSLYRKARYSATGDTKTFKVLEADALISEVYVGGVKAEGWSQSDGTVMLKENPTAGTDNVEIVYSIMNPEKSQTIAYETDYAVYVRDGDAKLVILKVHYKTANGTLVNVAEGEYSYNAETKVLSISRSRLPPEAGATLRVEYRKRTPRDDLLQMKYTEMFNGAQDNRIFLYGDGSCKTYYSGITETGRASAEYFPDLNEAEIGATNAPLTALVKHYNRLLAFKDNEAYSIYASVMTLADGSATTGFYITSVNKDIGCAPSAQAILVENRIRTLDGCDIYEWRPTSNTGNITYDQRNAERISQRIQRTLGGFDLAKSIMHYDKYRHEFYCICGGTALVQNVDANAWYEYGGFDVAQICDHEGKNFCLLSDGGLATLVYDAQPDAEAVFESGDIDYDKPNVLKYSPEVWVNIKPENGKAFAVGVSSDTGDTRSADLTAPTVGAVKPTMRTRLKLRKLTTSKLRLSTTSRMTITGAQINIAYTNNVK